MTVLEYIGAMTVLAFAVLMGVMLYAVAKEVIRSLHQWCRICRVVCGRRWKTKALKDWRTFFKGWWREFGESYGSKQIGGIILPYNPRKPVRRSTYE